LEHAANVLSAAMHSDSHEYEAVYLRSLLSTNNDYPWREVPATLAGNRQLWVIDVILDRMLLPNTRLVDQWVTCPIRETESVYSACVGDGRIFDPPMSATNVNLPVVETEAAELPVQTG